MEVAGWMAKIIRDDEPALGSFDHPFSIMFVISISVAPRGNKVQAAPDELDRAMCD
jgi:hypothetical protein